MCKITEESFRENYDKMTVTDLTKFFNVSRSTIVSLAKKYGLPQKTNGGYKPKKAIRISKEELKRLYNTTRTSDLAKTFGVSVATLVRIIKENGIEIKKTGRGVRQRKIIVEG
jgi:transposase